MSDAGAAYLTGTLWIVLFAAYGVRVARLGVFRSARVDGVGGTAVMGRGIMTATYWGLEPIVKTLVALRLTPNVITTGALVLGVGAGVAIAFGYFGLACLLATISTLGDILDGQVARYTNTGSARGELYDAVVDRYTEFVFIAGFAIEARDSLGLVAIALLALQASYMISYASARAEALRVEVPRGLMRRHERAAVLTLTAGLTPLLGPGLHARWEALPSEAVFAVGLALVGVIGTYAGIRRFVLVSRAIR